MTEAAKGERPEPGKFASVGLSVLMHGLLIALLIYGIRWQSSPRDTVEVDLVRALPQAPAAPPEPAPPPKPEPRPEPPRPPPKPEPKPEPKPPPKPDIAVKEKPAEKPRPPPKPKPEPKPEPRPDAQRRLMEEQLARETQQLAQARAARQLEQEMSAARAQQAAAVRARALADYAARVRAKIRGKLVVPPAVKGNPEAVFDVTQLPSGEVLSVKLKRSSGLAVLDEAIERAILGSSPLPKPDQPELFQRVLELKFKPLEE